MSSTNPTKLFHLPDGRTITYIMTEAPMPGAPTVLLSNSLCAPLSAWDRVVPVLSTAGFAVLRYDQPGHGTSGVPANLQSTTFDTLADDVAALLAHLALQRLHGWVGVSMGASTGVYFAARYPGVVRRLVVCDTVSGAPVNLGVADPFVARVRAMREAGSLDGLLRATMERWFGRAWMDSNPAEAVRMRDVSEGTTMDGFETCCAALSDPGYDLRGPRLEAAGRGCEEALVVVGEKDADLPTTMREIRAGLEKGSGKPVELEVIKGAGHVSFVDGFDEFCDVVVSFLQK
ncbi:3-oxoadipate enol-lactonase [Coniochaeta hoffmannii]|uniref:3-oxoadipate enol-lactonase n=1 Tax=Coniochaeta hoffmannii TaxID=91930 RepID=A0AA38S850_9PEZI|nr:3-oxoadipate enol-lactonase [Coniochaeta hoffmannii]